MSTFAIVFITFAACSAGIIYLAGEVDKLVERVKRLEKPCEYVRRQP